MKTESTEQNIEKLAKIIFDAKENEIVIYGAAGTAKEMYSVLKAVGLLKIVGFFLVASTENNPEKIGEIPVFGIDNIDSLEDKTIFVATLPKYFYEISISLKEKNCKKYYWYTYGLGSFIREKKCIEWMTERTSYEMKQSEYEDSGNQVRYYDIYKKGSNKGQYYKASVFDMMPKDEDEWRFLKQYDFEEEYQRIFGKYRLLNDLPQRGNEICRLDMYMICSHADRKLKRKCNDDDFIPVQAGAERSNFKAYPCRDSDGDNISGRNITLSEMTGIYWIWKNTPKADYKGVCHYRRRFVLNAKMKGCIKENNIDVVLPIPRVALPSNAGHFYRNSKLFLESDEAVMLDLIKENLPEYYETACRHFRKDNMFYPCNMLIAKESVFSDFCSFVFPLLIRLDDFYKEQGINRNDKFAAYLAELITSLYFVQNKDKLKIAVSEFQMLG